MNGGLPIASNDERSSHKPATDLEKEPDEQQLVKYLAVDGQMPENISEPLPLPQARGGSRGRGSRLRSGFA